MDTLLLTMPAEHCYVHRGQATSKRTNLLQGLPPHGLKHLLVLDQPLGHCTGMPHVPLGLIFGRGSEAACVDDNIWHAPGLHQRIVDDVAVDGLWSTSFCRKPSRMKIIRMGIPPSPCHAELGDAKSAHTKLLGRGHATRRVRHRRRGWCRFRGHATRSFRLFWRARVIRRLISMCMLRRRRADRDELAG